MCSRRAWSRSFVLLLAASPHGGAPVALANQAEGILRRASASIPRVPAVSILSILRFTNAAWSMERRCWRRCGRWRPLLNEPRRSIAREGRTPRIVNPSESLLVGLIVIIELWRRLSLSCAAYIRLHKARRVCAREGAASCRIVLPEASLVDKAHIVLTRRRARVVLRRREFGRCASTLQCRARRTCLNKLSRRHARKRRAPCIRVAIDAAARAEPAARRERSCAR